MGDRSPQARLRVIVIPLLSLCLAVLCAEASAAGQAPVQQQAEAGVVATRQTPAVQYPANYSLSWIDDAEFVYGPALLSFDINAYLAAEAPQLSRHAEFIAHWCGYYSISPKVVLTLIDVRSGLISNPSAGGTTDDPLRGLLPADGFEGQIKQVLSQLYDDFYAYRVAQGRSADATELNAATFALLNLFRNERTVAAFASAADEERVAFQGRYRRLFPSSDADVSHGPVSTAVPPTNLLQLPWTVGTSWYFNGVHTTTGTDPGVLSSIDFTRTWSLVWGDNTSSDYVVAAHDGTVTVFSACSVRVTSSTGWATNYYHLSDIAVANGAQVTRNQTLAVYANTLAQALCQGGNSTGPHVHFSLLLNGVLTALADASLSGFVVHPGRFSYDYSPSYMWLEKNGIRYYAYAQPIASTPALPPFTDDPVQTTTAIKAVHIAELRARIDALRSRFSLSAYPWVDSTITAGVTAVKAVHITDLRTALGDAYAAAGRGRPSYTDATLTPQQTQPQTAHINELRAALLAIE